MDFILIGFGILISIILGVVILQIIGMMTKSFLDTIDPETIGIGLAVVAIVGIIAGCYYYFIG